MATPIGDAYVEVRADTRQVAADVERGVTRATRDATREMGGLERNVRAVGAAAKLFIAEQVFNALGKVKDFADESIQAYTDLTESINAVNVVFEENADEVQKLGENAARNLGLSNAEFNALSVSVSAFVDKIAAGLGQDVPGTLDTLTTRIADFASVMNIEVAEAFEKFRSGLAGESEPLRRFGIDVSAATVEQTALKAGLIETGEEMTEAEKVTARYLAIMEQTEKVTGDFARTAGEHANRMRILAAETENLRARTGEALVPAERLRAELGFKWSQALGLASSGILQLTTNADAVDHAISKFEILLGQTADTAKDAATIVREYGVAWTDLLPRLDLSSEELNKLRDADEDLLTSLGFTQEQITNLRDALENELAGQMREQEALFRANEIAANEAAGATKDLADETGELNDEVKTAAQLLDEQQEAVRRNIDPMYNLWAATRDEADAQAAVNEAIEEFGTGSPEHLDALLDLSEKSLDLSEAQDQVRVNTDLTREAFIRQQIELGLTRGEAELLAEEFERLNAFKFRTKTIDVVYRTPTREFRQHGGPVTAGMPYIVGEAGPELFIPRLSGEIVSNNDMRTFGGATSIDIGGIHFHGTVDEATARRAGESAAEAAIERLTRARLVR